MERSVKPRAFSIQSTKKVYFVKRNQVKNSICRQAQHFFKTPNYQGHQSQIQDKNLTVSPIIFGDQKQFLDDKTKINSYSTVDPSNMSKNKSLLYSLVENQISKRQRTKKLLSRQISGIQLFQSVNKNKIKKKYVFQTICDSNFNKMLQRKQIIIGNQEQNPQNSQILPKISKRDTSKYNSSILDSRITSMMENGQTNSRIYQKEPYHKIQKQFADKFSMQKMNEYRKIWLKKQKKRRQMNETNKQCDHAIYHRSLIHKSQQKGIEISLKNNLDTKQRKSKSNWQQQLRGQHKNYVTIGRPTSLIPGLKGFRENRLSNLQVKPIHLMQNKIFISDQVYKCNK